MHIDLIPNRGSKPTLLLRSAHREGKRIVKTKIANITHWPPDVVEALRLALKGEKLVPVRSFFESESTLAHGHVEAILGTIRKLGLDAVISSRSCRERDLVVAMIVQRILHPASKLKSVRLWKTTSLADELNVGDADVNEVYDALDWLEERTERIERKLASRHLAEGERALYDVSSTSYQGRTCSLALFGYNRDGRRDLPCIVFGLLTDGEGRPIAVRVYPGNTADPGTVPDQVEKLRKQFNLREVTIVGDRGMITRTRIEELRRLEGVSWITAVNSRTVKGMVESGALQLSLFDKQDLAEITHPDHPGERFIACFNPLLAEERSRKREDLLRSTEKELARIEAEVSRRRGTPMTEKEIALKVGRVIDRRKMAKHFELDIRPGLFSWRRKEEAIAEEAALDGIYVIRASVPAGRMSSDDVVRTYKSLARVERAFRTMKGFDLRIRPINHRTEARVRAHFLLVMLAYYVEWHMREALAPLLFQDEHLPEARLVRDPVAKASLSGEGETKKASGKSSDGFPLECFSSMLAVLGTRARNRHVFKAPGGVGSFHNLTLPTEHQKRAFELLGLSPA